MLWLRHTLEVARQTLVLLARGRVTVLLAVAVTLLAALLGGVAPRAAAEGVSGQDFVGISTYLMVFMFVLPVTLLYLGVAAVHGDLEDRTATYLFVRPVRRSALLLGKWLAAALLGWLLVAWAVAAVSLAVSVAAPLWRLGLAPRFELPVAFALVAAPAALAYAAVGCLLGAFFRRPLVAAAVFFVGWEFIASMVPPQAGVRTMTVADPVRRWLRQVLDPAPSSELSEVLEAGLDEFIANPDDLGDPRLSLLRFVAVVLALALWIYGRREYDARARD